MEQYTGAKRYGKIFFKRWGKTIAPEDKSDENIVGIK